ncbi:proton-coupled folate transporter-like [Ptychodera flava]|uniref:proton-coupled folate transporter-like n=1 Tax=Ptychodera flava TaxID=63121 RepID=UPI003969BFF2
MGVLKYLHLVTVEPACLLFTWAIFMQGPATQQLLIQKVCNSLYNQTICQNLNTFPVAEDHVQTVSSHWVFYFTASMAIPGMVSALFISSWSDIIGRKLPMLIPSFGATLGLTVLVVSSLYMHLPYQLILVAGFLLGCAGGFGTFNVMSVSYISDITDEEQRTKRIGILHAMIFVGGTIGLLTGGILKVKIGFTAVYVTCLSLHFLLILYVAIRVKESLRRKNDDLENSAVSNETKRRLCAGLCRLSNAKRAVVVTFRKREDNKRKHLLILIVINFLVMLCIAGQMDLIVLYTQHRPLHWPASILGAYLAFGNVLQSLALLVVFPIYVRCTTPKTRLHDVTVAQIGFLFASIGFTLISLASTTWMMFCASLTSLVAPMPIVILPSLRSKLVDHNELGAMFAITASLEPLFGMCGSMLFNNLYPVTLSFSPGFSFVVMAIVIFIPVLLLQIVGMDMRRGTAYKYTQIAASELEDLTTGDHSEEIDMTGNHVTQNGID